MFFLRKKNIAILTIMLVVIMACFQQGSVISAEGAIIDNGIKERLVDQYGLETSEPLNPAHWGQTDVGISNPILIFINIGRFFFDPYVFVTHGFIHHLIDID